MPAVTVDLGKTFGKAPNGVVYALHVNNTAKIVDYIGNDKNVVFASNVVVDTKIYKVIHMETECINKLAKLFK